MTGLVYEGQLNDRTQLKSTLSWNYNKVDMVVDTLNSNLNNTWQTVFHDQSQEHKLSLTADLRYRVLQNANLFAGVIADHYIIKSYNEEGGVPYPLNDSKDDLRLLRLYAQYQHIFSPSFTATLGAHSMYLPLNGSFVVEPRAGMEYKLGQSHTIGLSGGMYSQLPPRVFFFVQTHTAEGVQYTNKELGFSKSWNINLAYNYQINKDWRIRAEAYYQNHFEIPAEEKAYGMSLLNYGAGENYMPRLEHLKNIGKGRNYGVELTVEKFYSDQYYLLLSTTLYRSLYTDPVLDREFSTVFDGRYIANLSGGVEWPINPKWTLFLSPRVAVSGGLRYTPVLEEQSIAEGKLILDESQWYGKQYPTYFRADARLGFRLNGKHTSQEFGLDLINITNHHNIASRNFDPNRGMYFDVTQFGFFPMVTYRLNFNLSK